MLWVLRCLALGLFFVPWSALVAQAIALDRIDFISARSFDETVQRLQWSIGGHGLTIVSAMNYEEILRGRKDSLPRAVVFEVMRRDWARRILEADPGSGIMLPVRLYAFENASGKTIVSYLRPGDLLESSGNAALREFSLFLDDIISDVVEESTSHSR